MRICTHIKIIFHIFAYTHTHAHREIGRVVNKIVTNNNCF